MKVNRKIVNKLNDLTGKEWIKITKTWFIYIDFHPEKMWISEVLANDI